MIYPAAVKERRRTTRASSGALEKRSTVVLVRRCLHVAQEQLNVPWLFQQPSFFLKQAVLPSPRPEVGFNLTQYKQPQKSPG